MKYLGKIENDKDLVTKEYVDDSISEKDAIQSDTPQMDGTASVGSSTRFARADHVHPTDTTIRGTVTPLMDGTATVGDSNKYARENHVHPTDTSRASKGIIADDFSSSRPYKVGEYCIYNGVLYKCTTAHSGEWDSSHWVAAPLGPDITDLRNALIKEETYADWEVGGINPTGGGNTTSNMRLRLIKFVGINNNVASVRSLTGYDFCVFAWNNLTGSYVGTYTSSGAFTNGGTAKWMSEFNFAAYPEYKFKVVLRNATSPSAEISVSDGSNVLFSVCRYDTDDTLTKEHRAADAKVTGDAISYLQTELKNKATVITSMASGTVASFVDGADDLPMKSVAVSIAPVQDLNGYDSPWPAGGGKNLYNPSWALRSNGGASVTVNGEEIHVVTTGETTYSGMNTLASYDLPAGTYYVKFKVKTGAVTGTGGLCGLRRRSDNTFVSGISFSSETLEYSFSVTATDECQFSVLGNGSSTGDSQASDFTLYDLIISTEDVAYEPYSNICPITGWTGANVYRTGKNLCYQPFPEYTNYNGTTWTNNADGSITVTGTPTATAYCIVTFNLPAGTYKVSGAPNDSAQGYNDILVQNSALAVIARDHNGATESVRTFTLDSYTEGVRVLLRATPGYTTDVTFYPMVTFASEANAAYDPYVGNIYSVDWTSAAGTVYSSILDLSTGKLMVNMRHKNARDFTWTWSVSPYLYATVSAAQISDAKIPSSNTEVANVLCSVAVKNSISNMAGAEHQPGIGISSSSGNMAIKLSNISSLDDWEDFIENTEVDIVYELATPLTYQLTPQEIKSLLGQNNVWSDSGNLSVTYRADTKLYIERLTKPEEDDMVANNNIASGKFFMVGNSLYLSTAAIAHGAAIVPGTNCTALSLADALNTINN